MTFFNHFHLLRFHLLNELALLYIYGYLFISHPSNGSNISLPHLFSCRQQQKLWFDCLSPVRDGSDRAELNPFWEMKQWNNCQSFILSMGPAEFREKIRCTWCSWYANGEQRTKAPQGWSAWWHGHQGRSGGTWGNNVVTVKNVICGFITTHNK